MIFGELAWHFGRSNVDFNWDMECERIDNNRWFPFYLRSIHLILKHTHTLASASMWTPTESISWEISARTRVSIKGVTHCISIQRNCTKLPSIIIFKSLLFSLISIKWPEVFFFYFVFDRIEIYATWTVSIAL